MTLSQVLYLCYMCYGLCTAANSCSVLLLLGKDKSASAGSQQSAESTTEAGDSQKSIDLEPKENSSSKGRTTPTKTSKKSPNKGNASRS